MQSSTTSTTSSTDSASLSCPPMLPFSNIMGQGRFNQLGGLFINGRPLPKQMRVTIIEMAAAGIKPCQISRQLRVSHGCVSKILNRYAETGSVSPGQIGGNAKATRNLLENLESDILRLKREEKELTASEIRGRLLRLGLCSRSSAPSVVSINRLLKAHSQPLKHSIHSILARSTPPSESGRGSSSSCSSSTSSASSPSSLSSDTNLSSSRRNRTSFTRSQLTALESLFSLNSYPNCAQRERISAETGLSEAKIQVWFSNRRARCRKSLCANSETAPSIFQHFDFDQLLLQSSLLPGQESPTSSPTENSKSFAS